MVLASAVSSKGFISSKNFSTEAAALVPKPRSINSAPKEKAAWGILKIPEPIPAKPASIKLTSSSFFFLCL